VPGRAVLRRVVLERVMLGKAVMGRTLLRKSVLWTVGGVERSFVTKSGGDEGGDEKVGGAEGGVEKMLLPERRCWEGRREEGTKARHRGTTALTR
jgi:hypothetical protein